MKQIEEFGQTPAQLFRSQHPPRLSLAQAEVVRPLASPVPGANTAPLLPEVAPIVATTPPGCDAMGHIGAGPAHSVVSYPRERVSRGAVLVVYDLLPWTERLVTVDTRRAIGYHGWRVLSPEMSPPFRLRPDTIDEGAGKDGGGSGGGSKGGGGGGAGAGAGALSVRRLGVPFAPGGVVSSRLLEPPPSTCRRDSGDGLCTAPLGGAGGSHDSLLSMGSLSLLPQSSPALAAPSSEPLQVPLPQHTEDVSPTGVTSSLIDHRHGHGHDMAPATLSGWWGGGSGYGGGGNSGMGLGSHLFAVHAESRLLFSGGHWDFSFRVTAVDTGRLVVSVARHRDVVTSLSLADGGTGCRHLVTASRDTTLMVWKVDPGCEPPVSASSLQHVLYGHDAPITCVCASAALDAIVSSGEDGTLVMHTLWGGEYIRTITPRLVGGVPTATSSGTKNGRQEDGFAGSGCVREGPPEFGMFETDINSSSFESNTGGTKTTVNEGGTATTSERSSRIPPPWSSVEWVGLSAAGYIVAYSPSDAMLRSYTINGHALGSVKAGADVTSPLHAFVFSEDGSVLLSGGHDRVVTLRWSHSLTVANDGAREGCGEAVLTGAAPPLAGMPGAGVGVKRFGSSVRCLALTSGERHLLVGLEDGTLGVLALDATYLRQRLRSKLDQLGI